MGNLRRNCEVPIFTRFALARIECLGLTQGLRRGPGHGIVFSWRSSSAVYSMYCLSVGQIGDLSDLRLLVCMMQPGKSLCPFVLFKFNQLTSLQHQPCAGLCTRLWGPAAETAVGDPSSRCLRPPQDRARRYRNMSATLLVRRSYL